METFIRGDKIKYPVLNIEYDTDTQTDNEYSIPIKIKNEDILKLDEPCGLVYLNIDEDTMGATFFKTDQILFLTMIYGEQSETVVTQISYLVRVDISDTEYSNGLLSLGGTYKEPGFHMDFSTIYNGRYILPEELQNNVKNSIGISTLTDDEILDIIV